LRPHSPKESFLKNIDLGEKRENLRMDIKSLEKAKQITIFETETSEALVDDSLNLCLQNFKELIQSGIADSKTVLLLTKVIDAYVKVEGLKVKQTQSQEEASSEQIQRIITKLKEIEGNNND